MFQSYSNNLSLQNKRSEIVASFNLGQNFTLEIATNTSLFWLISPTEDTHCYKLIVCFFNIKKHSIDNPIIWRIFFFPVKRYSVNPEYSTCTSSIMHLISLFPSIMHLISPPKKLPNRVCFFLHFSWVSQPSQEKLKTMLMQNFGGQIRCIMGDVHVA